MAEILRPTTTRGPLGIPRKTRLEFREGVLTVFDVHGRAHPMPTARLLMPYSSPGQRLSAGLVVCDDAGRLLAALDIAFDPYAVTAFAKQHGLNVRIREGDFTTAMAQVPLAPNAQPIEVLARWFLWEYLGVYLVVVICAFAGWHIARAIGELPGFGAAGTGLVGVACGLLVGLSIGPLITSIRKRHY